MDSRSNFFKENNSRDIWISYDEQSGKHCTVASEFFWSWYIGVNANLRCIRVAIPWRIILHSLLCGEKNVKWSPQKNHFLEGGITWKFMHSNAPNRIWGPPESQNFSMEVSTSSLRPLPRTAITNWTLQPPHSKIASYAYVLQCMQGSK